MHALTHLFQDILDSVEALIKKHEDFEKLLEAQEEKVNAVDHFAQKLMAAEHYDTVAIANRRDGVLQRCVSLSYSQFICLVFNFACLQTALGL